MIEFVEGGLTVKNGFAGHPKFVDGADIVSLSIADEDDELVESVVELEYIKVG